MKKSEIKFCAYRSNHRKSEIENFRLDISWKGKLIKEEKYQEETEKLFSTNIPMRKYHCNLENMIFIDITEYFKLYSFCNINMWM